MEHVISERPDSLTIKESAKGDLYFEIKVYGDTMQSVDSIINRGNELYVKAKAEIRNGKV